MSNTQDKGKLFDILPPPLEKITRGYEKKTSSPTAETKKDTNEGNKEKESVNAEVMQMKRGEPLLTYLIKQDSSSKYRQDEMDSFEKMEDGVFINRDNSIFSFPTNNNIGDGQDTNINEPIKGNKTTDSKTNRNSGFDISSVYQDLILTKEEINEVVEYNEEFRNLLESETITQFMDECLNDPVTTFENYKSDKNVLKFIQLLLNYMCGKYSYHHANNLYEHFTFEKKN